MKKVLLLGGTGFVGRHVCEHLNRLGIRTTVPTRRLRNGQAVQMLPMVELVEADVHDPAHLARLVAGHDAVINLVAILHGSQRQFRRVHVDLPVQLAQAMQTAGVQRLIHVSALGADTQGPSRYLRSKGAGEEALQAAGLDLTLLRPSVIFGAEDRFLNLFAAMQKVLPVVALPAAGARFQPIWVGDVAQAVVAALGKPSTIGQTIECVGPEVWTLGQLVEMAGRLSGHPRPVFGMPAALGYFQALAISLLPGPPLMSTDNLSSMEVDNVASGQLPTQSSLGIEARAVEAEAALYLDQQGRADPLLKIRKRAA